MEKRQVVSDKRIIKIIEAWNEMAVEDQNTVVRELKRMFPWAISCTGSSIPQKHQEPRLGDHLGPD